MREYVILGSGPAGRQGVTPPVTPARTAGVHVPKEGGPRGAGSAQGWIPAVRAGMTKKMETSIRSVTRKPSARHESLGFPS
jgi:hypothetical protein